MFRFWQTHSEEYKFMWNTLAAGVALQALSDSKKQEVFGHYLVILELNVRDPRHDVAACAARDLFWLSFTMADLAIPPMLSPKPAKWFNLVNPRGARARLFSSNTVDEVARKVQNDIQREHGIWMIQGLFNFDFLLRIWSCPPVFLEIQ